MNPRNNWYGTMSNVLGDRALTKGSRPFVVLPYECLAYQVVISLNTNLADLGQALPVLGPVVGKTES